MKNEAEIDQIILKPLLKKGVVLQNHESGPFRQSKSDV